MNKVSLFASAAVVAAALSAAPVFAQGAGPFADVPTDHWAYQSVDKLQKAGVVIGYPDGTYGGKRAMTRYEFAVAIARLLDILPKSQGGDFATKADLAGLATKEEVDQLRNLINEFRTELQTLGVDVDNLKKRMDALEGRVTAIENEMKRVKLTGSVNLMVRGNHRRGNDTFAIIDQNGYRVTNTRSSISNLRPRSGAIFADTRVFHDLDLNINARLSDTATAEATINFGNYLGFLNSISSYSGVRSDQFGQTPYQGQEQTIYKLALSAPVRVPGVGSVNLSAGRIPMQLTPYTLKLIDVDAYFYNDKTDLGDIPLDGAKALFNVGPVGVTAFAAKVDPIKYVSNANGQLTGSTAGYGLYAGASRPFSANGSAAGNGFRGGSSVVVNDFGVAVPSGNRPTQSSIQPNRNGAMAIENIAGARATFGTGKYGAIGAHYIAMSGKPNATLPVFQSGSSFQQTLDDRAVFDRVFVYGADFNGTISGIGVNIAYNVSDTAGNRGRYTGGVLTGIDTGSKRKINDANEAFDAGLSYTTGALTIGGGYKEIGPYFAAPGYWGRIGAWTNPVDIEGGYVRAGYALGAGLTLSGEGQFYKGTGKDESFGGLRSSDKINNFRAGLKYGVTSASNVDLGIEYTQYKLSSTISGNGGKPEEYFINIGYGYSFNPTTSFKLLYQIVDYKDKNTGFDTQNQKGGIAAAQFSVKF